MNLYKKTIEYVDLAFNGKNIKHFERTVYWFEKFSPIWSEAHQIAAYSHDIERANRGKEEKYLKSYTEVDDFKHHQERGAEIMDKFLYDNGADEAVISKVRHLISKHEVGGDTEQDALMDADSVSFFETNAEMFVKNKAPIEGYEKVKGKLDWMFDRIKSSEAKECAHNNYARWVTELEKCKMSS